MIIVPEKEALIRKFAGRKIRFYRKKAKMTQDELEGWYDETYQMCLLAFLELDNVERTKKVAQLKASFGK